MIYIDFYSELLVGQKEVFVKDGGIGFDLDGFTIREEFEKTQVSFTAQFPHLIVSQDLVDGAAGVIGGGEVASAVAEDVSVEDKDKVVFFNKFFPELSAVVFISRGVI